MDLKIHSLTYVHLHMTYLSLQILALKLPATSQFEPLILKGWTSAPIIILESLQMNGKPTSHNVLIET